MRWQSLAVGAGLLLPPVALAAAVWPDDASGQGPRGGEIEAELAPGDEDTATSNGVSSIDFLVTGPGTLTIDVEANDFDPTVTTVDPDSGRQLDYNDDRGDGSLNSRLVVDLGDGESVVAQVRSLNGPPGGRFTIAVSGGGDGDGDDGDDGGDDGAAGETEGDGDLAAEPFTEPLGDDPIVVEGAGYTVRLYTDETGSSCIDVQSANSGSGTCASSIDGLVQRGGFGGSSDGRTSTIEVASLVGPEVSEAVGVLADGSEVPLELLELPGRVEQVVVGRIRVGGDAFDRPSTGVAIVLRDDNGDVLETWET
jgi:hypothetical protein